MIYRQRGKIRDYERFITLAKLTFTVTFDFREAYDGVSRIWELMKYLRKYYFYYFNAVLNITPSILRCKRILDRYNFRHIARKFSLL